MTIIYACANPVSTAQGTAVNISATITENIGNATIADVTATITDQQNNTIATITNSDFQCDDCASSGYTTGTWQYDWDTDANTVTQAYNVNLDVKDSLGNESVQNNIQPSPLCNNP